MAPSSQFRTRAVGSSRDRSAVTRLWSENIAAHRTTAERRMCSVYGTNPSGGGRLLLLETADGTPVAAQGMLPRQARLPGVGEVTLGVLLDMAADPSVRTLGPALKLLRATLESEGGDLRGVYTYCNPQSEPVFRRCGMTSWAEVTVYKRPVNVQALTHGSDVRRRLPVLGHGANLMLNGWNRLSTVLLSPGIAFQVEPGFSADLDQVGEDAPVDGAVVVRRTQADLEWRFGTGESIDDLRVIHARARSTGRSLGYAAVSVSGGSVYVLDIYAGARLRVFSALLNEIVLLASASGAAFVAMEFAGPPAFRRAVVASGFVPRDRHVVLRWQGGDGDPTDLPPPYLTLFDREP